MDIINILLHIIVKKISNPGHVTFSCSFKTVMITKVSTFGGNSGIICNTEYIPAELLTFSFTFPWISFISNISFVLHFTLKEVIEIVYI